MNQPTMVLEIEDHLKIVLTRIGDHQTSCFSGRSSLNPFYGVAASAIHCSLYCLYTSIQWFGNIVLGFRIRRQGLIKIEGIFIRLVPFYKAPLFYFTVFYYPHAHKYHLFQLNCLHWFSVIWSSLGSGYLK